MMRIRFGAIVNGVGIRGSRVIDAIPAESEGGWRDVSHVLWEPPPAPGSSARDAQGAAAATCASRWAPRRRPWRLRPSGGRDGWRVGAVHRGWMARATRGPMSIIDGGTWVRA